MPRNRRDFWWLLLLALPALSCSLISPPQRPVIPTPPATVPLVLGEIPNLVTDPVGTVAPAADPLITELINEVSAENLVAIVQTLANFGTRQSLSETQAGDFGIGAARRWIHDELVRVGAGRLQVRYDDFRLPYQGLVSEQRNVVAVLPGTAANGGTYVFMAHYDSRTVDVADGGSLAPGANDNASGVAALLEVARLMSSRPWNQTVVFVAFAAEEQGTHGSNHFVTQQMLDGARVDAGINNDIVGGRPGIPQAIRVFATGDPLSETGQLARYMSTVSALYVPAFSLDIQYTLDREGRWSDHREFVRAGIPAVRLTESVEDPTVQHTSADTPDRLDYTYLRQVAQLNLAVAANLAGAPARPAPPVLARMADAGAYILTWTPDPLVAGYAISFRPLDAPGYGDFHLVNSVDAGNVALTGLDPTLTYGVSLAALDGAGRISLFSPEIIVGPNG